MSICIRKWYAIHFSWPSQNYNNLLLIWISSYKNYLPGITEVKDWQYSRKPLLSAFVLYSYLHANSFQCVTFVKELVGICLGVDCNLPLFSNSGIGLRSWTPLVSFSFVSPGTSCVSLSGTSMRYWNLYLITGMDHYCRLRDCKGL